MLPGRLTLGLLLAPALLVLGVGAGPPSAPAVAAAASVRHGQAEPAIASTHTRTAFSEVRLAAHVIGQSVDGRPILACHRFRADEGWARTVVVIGQMHGDETAGRDVVHRMLRGALPRHLDLWVIVSMNPDGYAAGRRQNAHQVDLNRNFPWSWRRTSSRSSTYSGPRAGSEPETAAVMAFLAAVDPRTVVSIHQPLDGVDAYHAKRPALTRALSRATGLPVKVFSCDGGCHGTLTQWFDNTEAGAAITVELPRHPGTALLGRVASGSLRVLAAGT